MNPEVFVRAVLLIVTMGAAGCVGPGGTPPPPEQRVRPVAAELFGQFDPALAQDPANGRLWMTYSMVDRSANSRWRVGLRIASSDNGGVSWKDNGILEPLSDVTVGPLAVTRPEPAIGNGARGSWMNETSTLVYDPHPAVPPAQRWKLVWHQTLWVDNKPYFASYSWIAIKTAARPEDLAAAPAKRWIGNFLLKPDAYLPLAQAPATGPTTLPLHTLHPELSRCVFAEPALHATRDVLYLALDCQFLGNPVQPYITLFRCSSPCDMNTLSGWKYLGRLTTPADAKAIHRKYKSLGAPALVQQGGETWLLATPVERSFGDDRYDGCLAFRFADLARGQLERVNGKLVVRRSLAGMSGSHHGACASHAALRGGMLYSQLVAHEPPEFFRIYRSGVRLP